MNTASHRPDNFEKELQEFTQILKTSGVHQALRYLNKRTPHRFTGIYRYDGSVLRNVALYDVYEPEQEVGADAPMEATYCSLLKDYKTLEINNSVEDSRVKDKVITPVVSYYGVLMHDRDGKPFGSLCHFDMKSCDERLNDFPLLEAAAEVLYAHLFGKNPQTGK